VPVRLADSSEVIGVDEIVSGEHLPTVDFLKVDVDGPDIDVLESAQEVLADPQVLGVALEVNWFGSACPSEHTFHNTDLFLRPQGYVLFGITVRPYSRPICQHRSCATSTQRHGSASRTKAMRSMSAISVRRTSRSWPLSTRQ
jgi:hypothetical protein